MVTDTGSDDLRAFSLEEINSVLSYSGLVSCVVRNGKCIGKKLLKYLVRWFFLGFFLHQLNHLALVSACVCFAEIRMSSTLMNLMLVLL